MTSQAAQIQTLINEIDAVLSKTSTRLPWVMSGETAHQRRVLEQTRQYLVTLQAQAEPAAPSAQPSDTEASAQQVLQAMLQEMNYLRSHILQPLRMDIERLHQEQAALNAEIQQLQAQRQQALLPQSGQQQLLEDFMRSLMARVQEQLSVQVTQAVANITHSYAALPGTPLSQPSPQLAAAEELTALSPEQRVAQVQRLQAQSDQLLLKLDSTLRVIFDSLQTNVQGYQESLGQGLEKMHSLGQQGEAMFAALVNRLAQQLGREASSYLQSSFDAGEWEPVATSQLPDQPAQQGDRPAQSQPSPRPEAATAPAFPEETDFTTVSDEQIDRLLEELRAEGVTLGDDALEPLNEELGEDLGLESDGSLELEAPQGAQLSPVAVEKVPAEERSEEEDIAVDPDEILPLEPLAEVPQVDLPSDQEGWSPDTDLATLDSALEVMNDLGLAEIGPQAVEDVAADASLQDIEELPQDEFYQSLFGGTETLGEQNTVVLRWIDSTPSAAPEPEPEPESEPEIAAVDSSDSSSADLDLFGGFPDPAEEMEEPQVQSEPAQLESLDSGSGIALFPDLASEQAAAESSLPSASDGGDRPFATDDTEQLIEESYPLASPEEDLLSSEQLEQRPVLEVTLENERLEQLAQDLQAWETADDLETLTDFGEGSGENVGEAIAPEETVGASDLGQIETERESGPVEILNLDVALETTLPSSDLLIGLDSDLPTSTFNIEQAAEIESSLEPPAARSIDAGTLTQPTLNSFFDAVEEPPEADLTAETTDETIAEVELGAIAPAAFAESPAKVEPLTNLATDLNLIWEAFDSPFPSRPDEPDESEIEPTLTAENLFEAADTAEADTAEASTAKSQAIESQAMAEEAGSDRSQSDTVQEEDTIFSLDTLTLENLFEGWPDEPVSTSKKN